MKFQRDFRRRRGCPDLTARVECLLRLYGAAYDRGEAAAGREQFCKDLKPLVAQYGSQVVIAALDGLFYEPWPSVSLH